MTSEQLVNVFVYLLSINLEIAQAIIYAYATPYLYRRYSMVKLTYTMPAGKAILFPILSGECDYGTEKSDAEVCKCATEGNELGDIFATIDGVRLQNLEQYRIQSNPGFDHAKDTTYHLIIKP